MENIEKNKKQFKEVTDFFYIYKQALLGDIPIEIGSVSFDYNGEYLLDCGANAEQYPIINQYIFDNKLNDIFRKLKIKSKENKTSQTVIFKYDIDDVAGKMYRSETRLCEHIKKILTGNKEESEISSLIKNWLPVCHAITHENTTNQCLWKYGVDDIDKPSKYCIIWIFEKVSIANIEGNGYLTVNFIYNENTSNIESIYDEIRPTLIDKIMPLIKSFALNQVNDFFIEERRKQAIKTAISAIMSRNMSHNLGSHVMAYLKQHLHSVEDIASRNALVDLVTSENWQDVISTKIKKGEDQYIEMPFLVGLGRFISYLQERQDFIATICTDFIPYFSSVNFKDFIYDELNPDLRCVRHFGKKDVEGKVADNLLLRFIAKSEGLSRQLKKVENNGFEFDKNNIILKFRNSNGMDKDHADLEEMRKIDFSLPGGIVGRQAFFSIIENIIRNSAKHGNRTKEQNLELTINIFDCKTIENINTGWQAEYKKKEDIKNDDLYIITITDNLKHNGNAVQKLSKAIDDDYIDESGKLKETNKGIKEIRISAAYLRGISVIEENNYKKDNKKTPIIQVASVGCKETENYLQYIFCVPKCKKIAFVITNSEQIDIDKCNENLQKNHCKLFTIDDFQQEAKINYDIIAVKDKDIYNAILPVAHSRIVEHDFGNVLNEQFAPLLPAETPTEDYIMPVDEYLANLYSKLKSANGVNEIYIRDDKDTSQICKTTKIKLISDSDFKNDDIKEKECYCYRKHHDTESEFNKFMKEIKPPRLEFIESITGGNSTDRLIRREPQLDDLWFYRHANAMNTHVAIFDERLFTKVTGIEHSKLEAETGDNDWWNEILKKYENDKKTQSAIQELIEQIEDRDYSDKDKIKIILQSRTTFDDLREKCENKLKTHTPQYAKNHQAVVFHQKKIDFFTCIYNSASQCFEIWGYANEQKFENGKYSAKYEYLGEIRKSGKDVITIDLRHPLKKFDYLSIHQGLLDKIYDKFDIPKAEKEKENKERFEVSNKLFDMFIDQKHELIGKNCKLIDKFLPRFIVHSGRSKPAFQDMPQKQPFIQYSAIENAVMDCKYTLIDLLDHAHYEK